MRVRFRELTCIASINIIIHYERKSFLVLVNISLSVFWYDHHSLFLSISTFTWLEIIATHLAGKLQDQGRLQVLGQRQGKHRWNSQYAEKLDRKFIFRIAQDVTGDVLPIGSA